MLTWCGGGSPYKDILVRIDEASAECLDREAFRDRKKVDGTYRKIIVDVMMELDIPFREFNRMMGMAMHCQLTGPGSCARHYRTLIYRVMKQAIKKKRG